MAENAQIFYSNGQLEIISIGDLKLMDEEGLIAFIIKKKNFDG